MSTTEENKTATAIWVPGWYELDQAIEVGQRGQFMFFGMSPPELQALGEYDLVFFNQLSRLEDCQVREATIEAIDHPSLGGVQGIATDGLDYTFTLCSGEQLVVNAEENPGKLYDNPIHVDTWSVTVQLSNVSDPAAIDQESES